MRKFFRTFVFVLIIALFGLAAFQTRNIWQHAQKREKAEKVFRRAQDAYFKTLGSRYSDDTRRALKVKSEGLEYDYKVLKYETKAEIAELKVLLICMVFLGMILYRTK